MAIRGQVDLRKLAERIHAIEDRQSLSAAHCFIDEPARDRIATGWTAIDAALGGGLPAGGLHEWFGVEEAGGSESGRCSRSTASRWTPPLCIAAHLAWRAIDHASHPSWAVWIGKQCHPYPRVLIRGEDRRLFERSLFVGPRDAAGRLWAIDLALRSPAVGVVIADGGGLDRTATQRIQLLARTQMKIVLAVCPPRQRNELSAAQTRWRVVRVEGLRESPKPRWSVELLRCKGMRPTQESRVWLLEWNRAEGAVHLSAGLVDLAGSPKAQVTRATGRLRSRTA